jgi:hypothetical protein
VLLSVFGLSAKTVFAQVEVPTYTGLTSIANPDSKIFGHWVIYHTLQVSTEELQRVINHQTGGAEFVALSNPAPGLSTIEVFANFERIHEDAGGALVGPYSDGIISTTVLNLALGTTEGAQLGHWSSAPEGTDAVYGSEVSTPAELKWKIEQRGGVQFLELRVRGSDGFKETIRAEVPQTQGFRFKLDPAPGSIRYLSDGPGGSHPSFVVALELDTIPIDPEQSTGLRAGQSLRLPGGRVRIKEVGARLVGRGVANHIDVQ